MFSRLSSRGLSHTGPFAQIFRGFDDLIRRLKRQFRRPSRAAGYANSAPDAFLAVDNSNAAPDLDGLYLAPCLADPASRTSVRIHSRVVVGVCYRVLNTCLNQRAQDPAAAATAVADVVDPRGYVADRVHQASRLEPVQGRKGFLARDAIGGTRAYPG